MKRASRLGLFAALATVTTVTFAWVAGADPAAAEVSHPGGVTEMCPEVLRGAPTHGLKKETEPPDGSEVQSGDVIKVKLIWTESEFEEPELHKALDCVTVDGDLAPDLSVEERDTANDGVFEHSYTVPDGLPPGTRLCDRGFVSGPGQGGGFEREKSNDVCFTVGGPSAGGAGQPYPPLSPPAPAPPPSPPPAPPSQQPSPPPAEQPPAEQPPAPAPIVAGPAGGPTPGAAVQAPSPAPVIAQGPQAGPGATLPLTGWDSRLLVLIAGAALLSGGLSTAARSGRRSSPLSQD